MLYHGSATAGLTELRPYRSEHGKPYVYFTKNPIIATFYTVHHVMRPYNWFPYGYVSEQVLSYSEYYPDAMADVYKCKERYIYVLDENDFRSGKTLIGDTVVFEEAVKISSCITIPDVYQKLLEYENAGQLYISRFKNDEESLNWIDNMIVLEIEINDLKNMKSDYCDFLQKHFPKAWERAK